MAFEMLVGLNVIDDSGYQQYRQGMTPILEEWGGGFGYDFTVARVLRSKTNAPINRVFTIFFPNERAMEAFFADPSYLLIRTRYFEHSVSDMTIMAKYQQ